MAETVTLQPSVLRVVRKTDPALVSYNIEMTEVTGGTFWKAYTPGQIAGTEEFVATTDRSQMLQIYPPIDLSGRRIHTLAKALGPVWVRTSGTWATKTYYDLDGHTGGKVPEGFQSVLTRAQWEGVLDFVKAVGGRLLVSVGNCAGNHRADGSWDPAQAKALFDFSIEYGVPIAAAEFMNEPNLLAMSGAPEGYTLADYCRDQDDFFRFTKENYPDVLLVGPSATCDPVGNMDETTRQWLESLGIALTRDIMAGCQVAPDVFSYHYYNGSSERGAAMGGHYQPEQTTTEEYLDVCASTCKIYLPLRDRYCPDAPIWVTESGEAACGGSTWASTYLDVLRTINELGRFCTLTHGIIFHNTLASSDYGWLDHATHLPRPDYWAVLLWTRLMGDTVFDTGEPLREGAHLYAHSRRDGKPGAAYVLVNNSTTEATRVRLPAGALRYELSAPTLRSTEIRLNGQPLHLGEGDILPEFVPEVVPAGEYLAPPATVTFFVLD